MKDTRLADGSKSALFNKVIAVLSRRRARWSIFVFGCFFAGACVHSQIVVGDCMRRNTVETLFLAIEISSEVGPDFAAAKNTHLKFVQDRTARMEERIQERPLAALFLNKKQSPKVQFSKVEELLAGPPSANDSTNHEVLRSAAKILTEVGEKWADSNNNALPMIGGKGSIHQAEMVSEHLAQFSEAVQEAVRKRDFESAESGCLVSRMTSSILLAYWSDSNTEQVRLFQANLKALNHEMSQLQSDVSLTGAQQKLIASYTGNVRRRSDFFLALGTPTKQGDGFRRGQEFLLATLAPKMSPEAP